MCWQVLAGELVAVVGPVAAGKSMLLMTIPSNVDLIHVSICSVWVKYIDLVSVGPRVQASRRC